MPKQAAAARPERHRTMGGNGGTANTAAGGSRCTNDAPQQPAVYFHNGTENEHEHRPGWMTKEPGA
jgi:hypothetical protein